MIVTYDKYYQTENLFGRPYPELIEFFAGNPKKGKVLDLGCGQGRDAIALARLGYSVTGIDISKVGIDQMNQIARDENLNLEGQVGDIYAFERLTSLKLFFWTVCFISPKRTRKKRFD